MRGLLLACTVLTGLVALVAKDEAVLLDIRHIQPWVASPLRRLAATAPVSLHQQSPPLSLHGS